MKLVIDIDEQLYTGVKERNAALETEYVCDELMKVMDNAKPLEEVLGDIKAKIEAKAKERRFYMDSGHPYDGLYEALEIIDKHISGKVGE